MVVYIMDSSNDNNDNDNSLTNDLNSLYDMIFNKSTVILLIWFLALHFTCYWLLKYFFSENIENLEYQAKLSRFLDIAILVFLTIFLTASYYSMHQEDKKTILENIAYRTKTYIIDSDSIYKTVVFILFFYAVIYLFRVPMNYETKPYFIMITEFVGWCLLLVIIFTKFFNDVFNFSMVDTVYSFLDWSNLPENADDARVYSSNGGDISNELDTKSISVLGTGNVSSLLTTIFPTINSEKSSDKASVATTNAPTTTKYHTTTNAPTTTKYQTTTNAPTTTKYHTTTNAPTTTKYHTTTNATVTTSASRESTSGSMESTTTPMEGTSGSRESTSGSMEGTSASRESTSKPMDSTTTPMEGTSASREGTSASMESTSGSMESTSASRESTSGSMESTSASMEGTSTPMENTNSMSSTTTTILNFFTTLANQGFATTQGVTTNPETFDNLNAKSASTDPITKSKEIPINTKASEVFNVNGQYTYDEAQLICAAYGSKLANYDQIEQSYNTGGEWCNYGWSDGQFAYYPTQKDTWNKLQKSTDEKIRNSCGRPGVNGGYLKDSSTKMGINCFGKKPELRDKDLLAKQQQESQIQAKSAEEQELNYKIEYWKQQIDNGDIKINHYNHGTWSKVDGANA